MPDVGYCTSEDVASAMNEKDIDNFTEPAKVTDAILGQTEWLQESTDRHWFTTETSPPDPLPTAPRTHAEDVLTVPASPHPAPSQQYRHPDVGGLRYPRPVAGNYAAVDLGRRDVSEITELLVLDATGSPTDWTVEKTEGRGEDYYLQVDDSHGVSTLYLSTTSLPARQNWAEAVIASYEYGIEGVSDTVRRAVALRASAQLMLDDDTDVAIPNDGQLISIETKADKMRREARDLLSIHMVSHSLA